MTSRYDAMIGFDRLSEKQQARAHDIIDDAQRTIDETLADCSAKMKPEKRHLLDGVQDEIDARVRELLSNYLSAPWLLFREFPKGRAIAVAAYAASIPDLCVHYLRKRMG